MSENKIEYLDIETPDGEAYAKCWVVEDNAGANAQCYIYGPKRGDEIFELVQKTLREAADRNGLPLRHIYTPSNKGALALAQRTGRYVQAGKNKFGNDTFEKSLYSTN